MKILAIAQREMRVLFLSPMAWVIFGVIQFIAALLFLNSLSRFLQLQPQIMMNPNFPWGVTEFVVPQLYGAVAFMFMIVIPLMTMRLIADERKNKTISLLLSAPVSMTEIILGKFLGLYVFLLIIILTVTLMPLSLVFSGPIDYGLLYATIIGLCLLTAAFTAIGLYMSSLTKQPIVAAISSFGILLTLWIIAEAADASSSRVESSFTYLSLLRHFESFSKGLFSSADFFYFIIIIAAFIILSIKRLDADRLQQ